MVLDDKRDEAIAMRRRIMGMLGGNQSIIGRRLGVTRQNVSASKYSAPSVFERLVTRAMLTFPEDEVILALSRSTEGDAWEPTKKTKKGKR